MRPKVRVPPCKFCAKQFRRSEHLHRHERIHTQEKPFQCHCGRAFSRRDLLSRHIRLAHGSIPKHHPYGGHTPTTVDGSQRNEINVEDDIPIDETLRPQSSLSIDLGVTNAPASGFETGGPCPSPTGSNALHEKSTAEPTSSDHGLARLVEAAATVDNAHPSRFGPYFGLPQATTDHELAVQTQRWDQSWDLSLGDNLDLLWGDSEIGPSPIAPSSFSHNYPMNFLAFADEGFSELQLPRNRDTYHGENEHAQHHDPQTNSNEDMILYHESGVMSRYESRLPSLQPGEDQQQHPTSGRSIPAPPQGNREPLQPVAVFQTQRMPWRLSKEEYQLVFAVIQSYSSVLPVGFEFPSRHALCRYVEGYFAGFHEHLPFIHLPTISIVTEAPELIMAVAAVGARYRFQRKQSHQLYLAARRLLDDQLRRRDAYQLPESVFSPPGLLVDGNLPSYSSPSTVEKEGPDGATPPDASPQQAPRNPDRDIRTMQAMILLIAMGTWNHRSLLKDAFSTASHLALMVREEHQLPKEVNGPCSTWREWVNAEGLRRTKFVAFSFCNLHSIAYDIPPKIVHSEIGHLSLPSPESHWRARNEEEWDAALNKDTQSDVPLQAAYASLSGALEGGMAVSSFGNYVLIHCIIQQVFFSRQLTLHNVSATSSSSLSPYLLSQLDTALRNWQKSWEATKDSSLDPSAPGGPLSFNATALFRLACIRVNSNLGPCRQLDSRDPMSIARAFARAPRLDRSSHVCRAALQSAHSLSIPVRIGIEFVARTQTLTWSIVHSLCNLECGLFLGKWLESVAFVLGCEEPLREDEKRLLGIVASIVNETDMGAQVQKEHNPVRKVKSMAAAVLRLWAYTFKGAHVFDIMGTIGAGLELCADMLQQQLDGG